VSLTLLAGSLILLKQKNFCLSLEDFRWLRPNFDWLEYLLLSLISLKVIFVYFSALIKPVIDVDAFQFYSIVAKGIFYDHTFTLPYLQQFIGDKPLLPFLTQGWVLLGLNQANECLIKLLSPTVFLLLLVIFYSALKRFLNRKFSLLFTFLFSTLPFLIYHATTAYADLIVTFYYFVGTIYLWLFLKGLSEQKASMADLIVSMVFLGFTVWAKKAGVVLAGIDLFVLLFALALYRAKIAKIQIKTIIISLLLFMIIAFPVVASGRIAGVLNIAKNVTGMAPTPVQTAPTGEIDILGTGLVIFARKTFLYADWQLTFGLLIVILLFFFKRALRPPDLFLLMIILLDITSLFVQFGSGETWRWLLDGTLLDRLLMNEVPLLLYYCAIVIGPILGWKDNSSAA
jgi:hypothetical protein